MPKLYTDMRDSCIERKRKKNGSVSDDQIKECKKMAAILYYKKTGKPVSHSDAQLALADELPDDTDLDILQEELDIFGSFEEWENWNICLEEDKENDAQ